jgi:hypothetical protein
LRNDAGDPRDRGDSRAIADRDRLDDRDLVTGDEAVSARHADSADERGLQRAEQTEKKKCDCDGKKRQQRAEFFPLQIAGDDSEKFHGQLGSIRGSPVISPAPSGAGYANHVAPARERRESGP